MAAVSIPPSPQALSTMTSRRVPLASVPNATNSPYRPTAATATKRPRSHASEQRDATYVGQPPAKRQVLEENDTEARRQALLKKASSTQSAVQKKLEAAREVKPSQKPVERPQKTTQDNYDTIRQWQKHYRKVFPQYVFYFENIPADARTRATKQIVALGAVCPRRSVPKFYSDTDMPCLSARGEVLLQVGHPHRHDASDPPRAAYVKLRR